jgi:hypothetical protein
MSTDPKTEEGKRQSRRIAFRHGLTATADATQNAGKPWSFLIARLWRMLRQTD